MVKHSSSEAEIQNQTANCPSHCSEPLHCASLVFGGQILYVWLFNLPTKLIFKNLLRATYVQDIMKTL